MKINQNKAAKTRKQIADEFGINVRTFYRKLNKLGVDLPSGLIYPADQEKVYVKLGNPKKVR